MPYFSSLRNQEFSKKILDRNSMFYEVKRASAGPEAFRR